MVDSNGDSKPGRPDRSLCNRLVFPDFGGFQQQPHTSVSCRTCRTRVIQTISSCMTRHPYCIFAWSLLWMRFRGRGADGTGMLRSWRIAFNILDKCVSLPLTVSRDFSTDGRTQRSFWFSSVLLICKLKSIFLRTMSCNISVMLEPDTVESGISPRNELQGGPWDWF